MKILRSERFWTWFAVHCWLGSVPFMVSLFVYTLTHGRTEKIAVGDSMLVVLMLTATTMIDLATIQIQGPRRLFFWSLLITVALGSAWFMLANTLGLALQYPDEQFDRGILQSMSLWLLAGAFVVALGVQIYITAVKGNPDDGRAD
jgi:hypothetical protein